jgi:hypothetical protein
MKGPDPVAWGFLAAIALWLWSIAWKLDVIIELMKAQAAQ